MRLLMLNNEFPPLGGGTGTVNQALLRCLAADPGLEIDLVTSAPSGAAPGGGPNEIEAGLGDQIHLYRLPVHQKNIHHASNRDLLVYALQALQFAWQRRRRYDFCFAWSAVPAGGVALALRRLSGLPYLVRVCGPDIPGFERRYGALYPLLTPVIRSIWKGARLVVAKCEAEAEMIRAVERDVNLQLVPNGVDANTFAAQAVIPDQGTLRLLCVARLIERKGQMHLFEAVSRLCAGGADITLDLVGTGDAEAAYRARVEKLGLARRVNFLGYVPRERIPDVYATAHVFVLPSYNEGMSVATLEAMAAGLPLVVTRTGGTADLVDEGGNGLTFDWADIETLTAHLQRLGAERALARQMGAVSRRKAEQLGWDKAAGQYRRLFALMAEPGK